MPLVSLFLPPPPLLAVHAALPSNTLAIYGPGQVKELTELVPGILNQLGPDSLASLRKLAESYQALSGQQQRAAGGGESGSVLAYASAHPLTPSLPAPAAVAEDDDEVPDLVESFEVEEGKEGEANKLDELSELPSTSPSMPAVAQTDDDGRLTRLSSSCTEKSGSRDGRW